MWLLCCCCLLLLRFKTNWWHSGTFTFPLYSIYQQSSRLEWLEWLERLLQFFLPYFRTIQCKINASKSSLWGCDGFGKLARKMDVDGIDCFVDDSWFYYLGLDRWGGWINGNIEFLVDGNTERWPLEISFLAFGYFVTIDKYSDKIWLLFDGLSSIYFRKGVQFVWFIFNLCWCDTDIKWFLSINLILFDI